MSYQTAHHFDPTALLMIKGEVDQSINAVESTVNALVEDQTLPFAIDDALHQIEQCGRVLTLIDLPNIGKIAQYCAELMRQIMQQPENLKMREVEALSEGTSVLKRYMEFATLSETDAPILLLDSLNRLELALGKSLTTEANEIFTNIGQLPTFELPKVSDVEESAYVHQLYKHSLTAVLAQKMTKIDVQAMKVVGHYLAALAQDTESEQYWGLVNISLDQLENNYLTDARLRTLIQIEQNIEQFLADKTQFNVNEQDILAVLALCIGQNGTIYEHLRSKLDVADKILSTDTHKELANQFHLPNSQTIHDVSNLIREEINDVRREIEYNYENLTDEQIAELQQKMFNIVNVLRVLNLTEAADKFNQQALKVVANNQELQSEAFAQDMMDSVLTVTNALGLLERQYTSNRLQLGVFNTEIVLDQVDKANETLLTESKLNITAVTQKLADYVEQPSNETLVEIAEKFRELSGACLFLAQEKGQTALINGAKFIELAIDAEQKIEQEKINLLLDILAAVDLLVDNLLNKQPVLQNAFEYALASSKKLA